MRINAFDTIKKIIKTLVLLTLFSISLIIISNLIDNKLIRDIKEFTSNGTKVLYISKKENYSREPIKLLKKYEIEYQYINTSNLSSIEKKKIENWINSKTIDNIIVIFKNGKISDALLDFESNEKLITFFQENKILPPIIGKVDGILASVSDAIKSDLMVLYLPYDYVEGIESQDEILRNISNKYSINYKLINAYLLSESQKQKLNLMLQVSEVQNQIVILIKDNEIVGSIREAIDEETYEQELKKFNFIDNKNTIKYINDYQSFDSIINLQEKNIIVIGKEECKYCDDVLDKLNTIGNTYSIQPYYLNIENVESELAKKIIDKLVELQYSDGFSTPLTIIVESNKIIDYIIGTADDEYFLDVLKENGLIKR